MNMNRFLEVNVGKVDKIIRLVLVIACVVLGLMLPNYWFFLGIIPLFSVLTGRCPVYSILGIRTCPIEKKS